MKIKYILCGLALCLATLAESQDPIYQAGLETRTQIFQDNIIVTTITGVPFIASAENNGSYLSPDLLPFMLLASKDTTTSMLNHLSGSIRIFPNPVADQLILQRDHVDGDWLIRIIDLQGRERKCLKWPTNVNAWQISTIDFSPGYFILILEDKTNQSITSYKILKL